MAHNIHTTADETAFLDLLASTILPDPTGKTKVEREGRGPNWKALRSYAAMMPYKRYPHGVNVAMVRKRVGELLRG